MSPRRQSPLTLEYTLLGLLSIHPNHGYNLFKELSRLDGVGMVWQIKQSQLYALLDKLENEGLIQAAISEKETYPPRKEYQLTPLGLEEFKRWRSSPVTHSRDLRQEFLARLYFARLAGPQVIRNLLDAQENLIVLWMKDVQNGLTQLSADQDYERTVLFFRLRQMEASFDWLKYCKSLLEENS